MYTQPSDTLTLGCCVVAGCACVCVSLRMTDIEDSNLVPRLEDLTEPRSLVTHILLLTSKVVSLFVGDRGLVTLKSRCKRLG